MPFPRALRPTRRDAVVFLAAAAALAGADRLLSQDPVLGSTVVDWATLRPEPTATGARRPFLRGRTATLRELSVHVTTVSAATAAHAPHRHPDEEMIVVKEGTTEVLIEGKTHRLGPGSLALMAPGEEHGIRNVGAGPASYYIVRWTTESTGAPRR